MSFLLVPYKLNITGVTSTFVLQCRSTLKSFISKRCPIIEDILIIRQLFTNEVSPKQMIIISVLEILSLLQLHININNFPYFMSFMTNIYAIWLASYEIFYDFSIICYFFCLTPQEREDQIEEFKNKNAKNIDHESCNYCSFFNDPNDEQLDEWDKQIHSNDLKEYNNNLSMLNAFDDSNKVKKWKKQKKNAHEKKIKYRNI